MQLTAILLRWYRSFNVRALGPADSEPTEAWNRFRGEVFPFVRVPLDPLITTIVGANESGKSHLLAGIRKVIRGQGIPGNPPDLYAIKDICRYCGFGGFDHDVWPEIGVEISVDATEVKLFQPSVGNGSLSIPQDIEATNAILTVVLNGANDETYATVYHENLILRTIAKTDWKELAMKSLPDVSILDSTLALPGEIHVDELIDLYEDKEPAPIVSSLAVQNLWRTVEPINIVAANKQIDQGTAERVQQVKDIVKQSTHSVPTHERKLVFQLFAKVLGIRLADLKTLKQYTETELGYVAWLRDEINSRIERELDISRYWDQDEDFRLSVSYKSGTFEFQITDRTGHTYTFNERSSGLRYFLSYYIQAKAMETVSTSRGAIILMDEPDSFLSASGQRSLMRVFETLVSRKMKHGPCQLVYTTHSPFLINRNFPDRIRLVRKGDGSEGTQYVERASVRRFEPVRSALSIDAADTLFLGSTNVVVEGHSDQKLITACVQRFGSPGRLESTLDLNSVTIVSCDGAPYAADLVKKAMRGDEKPPIVVVLLDGDAAGENAVKQVVELINENQVCTLREVNVPNKAFTVLEDMIPAVLLAKGIKKYTERLGLSCAVEFDGSIPGIDFAKRIVAFCRANIPEVGSSYEDIEIRFGVVDAIVDLLGDTSFTSPELVELEANVACVFAKLNGMIEHAERHANRHSLKKMMKQHVDLFLKRFSRGTTKGDLRKTLKDMYQTAFGRGEDIEKTQKNLSLLMERLDAEVSQNDEVINSENWRTRLERLRNEPWAKVLDWKTVVAQPKPPPLAPPESK